MKKIFLITLFLSCFIFNKSIAATGEAQAYTITMTYLELCDNTSTDSSCNNPIVLGSGESPAIDIANTAAGSAAASYGDITKAQVGTTYTYMQITMKRQLTVKGQVGSCYTKNDAADVDTLAVGTTTAGDLASITTSFSVTGTGRGDNIKNILNPYGILCIKHRLQGWCPKAYSIKKAAMMENMLIVKIILKYVSILKLYIRFKN
mgnify:CR=1 FL=1